MQIFVLKSSCDTQWVLTGYPQGKKIDVRLFKYIMPAEAGNYNFEKHADILHSVMLPATTLKKSHRFFCSPNGHCIL
jgi:hypothetical protein